MAWGTDGQEIRAELRVKLSELRRITYPQLASLTELASSLNHEEKKAELLTAVEAFRTAQDRIERILNR